MLMLTAGVWFLFWSFVECLMAATRGEFFVQASVRFPWVGSLALDLLVLYDHIFFIDFDRISLNGGAIFPLLGMSCISVLKLIFCFGFGLIYWNMGIGASWFMLLFVIYILFVNRDGLGGFRQLNSLVYDTTKKEAMTIDCSLRKFLPFFDLFLCRWLLLRDAWCMSTFAVRVFEEFDRAIDSYQYIVTRPCNKTKLETRIGLHPLANLSTFRPPEFSAVRLQPMVEYQYQM